MDCPNCGHPLSLLEEVLAATHTGTQCSRCWKFLRRLKPVAPRTKVTAFKAARRPRPNRLERRAA